jgi:hypothetical protein
MMPTGSGLSPGKTLLLQGASQLWMLRPQEHDSASLGFQSIQVPTVYMNSSRAVRHAGTSQSGEHIAVAGEHGLALYNVKANKWRLFGDVNQERTVHVRALAWWADSAIVVVSVESSAPRAVPHLLMYPRDHLDASSQIISVPLQYFSEPPTSLCTDARQSAILCASGNSVSLFRVEVEGSIEKREQFSGTITLVKHQTLSLSGAPIMAMHILPKLPDRAAKNGDSQSVFWWQMVIGAGGADAETQTKPRVAVLDAAGTLGVFNFTDSSQAIVAHAVNHLWVVPHSPGCPALLANSYAIYGGADIGLRLWFAGDGINEQHALHGRAQKLAALGLANLVPESGGAFTLLSNNDPLFQLDCETVIVGLHHGCGTLVGVRQDVVMLRPDSLPPLPCFGLRLQLQPVLQSVLLSLLQLSPDDVAVLMADFFRSKPLFQSTLELLLHAVLENRYQFHKQAGRSVLSAEASADLASKDTSSAGQSPANNDAKCGAQATTGGGGRMNSSAVHDSGYECEQNCGFRGTYEEVEKHEATCGASIPFSAPADISVVGPPPLSPHELGIGRSSEAAANLTDLVRLLSKSTDLFHQVIVGTARTSEPSRWHFLFPLAGRPIDLFKQCCRDGTLRIAAAYMVLVHDTLADGSGKQTGGSSGGSGGEALVVSAAQETEIVKMALMQGHRCALELLNECLYAEADMPLAQEVVRFARQWESQLAMLGNAMQDCGSSVEAVLELCLLQLLRDFKFQQAESFFGWLQDSAAPITIAAVHGDVMGAAELNGALAALMKQYHIALPDGASGQTAAAGTGAEAGEVGTERAAKESAITYMIKLQALQDGCASCGFHQWALVIAIALQQAAVVADKLASHPKLIKAMDYILLSTSPPG